MSHSNMEADKMLDVYIHDYLVKRKLSASAGTFQAEAQVLTDRTAIDAPGGFLLEWWSVFWDIFIARFRSPVSSSSGPYNVGQTSRTMEQQQQQLNQMQMQQFLQQKQQQERDETRNEAIIARQGLGKANSFTKSVHDNNPPAQRNSLSEANKKPTKPRSSENIGQHLDASHTHVSKPEILREQHSRQIQHSTHGGNLRFYPPLKDHAKQFQAPQKVDRSLTNMSNLAVNYKAAGPGGSPAELSGSDYGVNNLLLRGWPLMGGEQLQLQQQIQMLLGNQYIDMGQGDQSSYGGDIATDRNLPVPVGFPLYSRADSAMLMKNAHQSQEQGRQLALLGQRPENPNSCIQHEAEGVVTGTTTMEVSLSNTSRADDQNRAMKKRKQLMSSGQTNSLGAANNTGLLPSSAPSTPSVPSMGDVISTSALPHDDHSSKACVYGSDVRCSTALVPIQTADVVPLVNHGSVDNSVESFLSDNADAESIISRCLGTSKDITFLEIGTIHSSSVSCCDLSSDGQLIAHGGAKEVVLWCTDSLEKKRIFEEHTDTITDVRFGPGLPRLASSSLDKTIKIWDVHNASHSIRSFTGHSSSVMSLDFHPTKEDLICSSDNVGTIRYWSIKNGGCAGVSKVPATQVRFQPNHGKYLAAAVANGVSLIDVETNQTCKYPLKGHISNVRAICWSSSGEYLASLTDDRVQVWKISPSGEQECMNERSVTGKRFRCCTFHPSYPSVLVLGSYQCLELWHMAENKMMILHEEPVSSLALARRGGIVASGSDNNLIRLWK